MPPTSGMTYTEALDKILEIVTLLLNFPFGERNDSPIFPQEAIDLLYKVAVKSESNRRKRNFGVIGGSATGIVGGCLAIAGASLIPFTFGASVGLIAAGTAVSVAGASVSIGFSFDKFVRDKGRSKLIQPTLERFVQFQKNLGTTIALLKVALYVVTDQKSKQGQLDLNMPHRIQRKLSNIVDDVADLKKQVEEEDQFNADGLIKDLSYFAEQLIESLDEMMKPVRSVLHIREAWYEKEIQEARENPFGILDDDCFEQLQAREVAEGRTFFQFAKGLFGIDPTDNTIDKSALPQAAAAVTNVAAKGGILTTRVAIQAADIGEDAAKIGINALRVAKGVSAAGIVLGALGVVVDVGFLGHAVYDLVKNKPEEFTSALKSMANIMENINNLKFFK